MKSALAAAVLISAALALPAAAQTAPQTAPQTGAAAGRLPNTFDQPAAPQRAAPTPAPAEVSEPSDPAKVAAAEAMLRTTIAAFQAGAPNYSDMTTDLADKVRQQAPTMAPIFAQLGALGDIAHVATQDGAELFLVGFENAPTQWILGQNDQGKIVALLFRPAPPPPAA
ncbi:hypothetical protein [Brevundimonas sp.]|jgi:hypothetical protein|uniref:hypothetical protein n=1 Tax=Brevundimonas sp. TaxID=1871086 RepID=UPI0037842AAA